MRGGGRREGKGEGERGAKQQEIILLTQHTAYIDN